MTRRLVLAWSTGATLGLAMGVIYATAIRDHWPRRR
jgi:hypothetical protein